VPSPGAGSRSSTAQQVCSGTERRAEHAIQRKLDAIAGALLEQQRGKTGKAFESLETAIRMEEET